MTEPDGGDGAPYRPVEERCECGDEAKAHIPTGDSHPERATACINCPWEKRYHPYRPSPPAQVPDQQPVETAITVDEALAGMSRWMVVYSDWEAKELQMALMVLRNAVRAEVRADERAAAEASLESLRAALQAVAKYRPEWDDFVAESGQAGTNKLSSKYDALVRAALAPAAADGVEAGSR